MAKRTPTYRGLVTTVNVAGKWQNVVMNAKDTTAMIARIEKATGETFPVTSEYVTRKRVNEVIAAGNL